MDSFGLRTPAVPGVPSLRLPLPFLLPRLRIARPDPRICYLHQLIPPGPTSRRAFSNAIHISLPLQLCPAPVPRPHSDDSLPDTLVGTTSRDSVRVTGLTLELLLLLLFFILLHSIHFSYSFTFHNGLKPKPAYKTNILPPPRPHHLKPKIIPPRPS